MDIDNLYRRYVECGMEVGTDSRHIREGVLFFALKGDNFDGNDFALKALSDGAKYAVVSRPELAPNPQCIVVEDTLATLQELARYHRDQMGHLRLVGITGTNGKTTTKELLAAILQHNQFATLYTEGNLNNHIGVPLTLLRLRPHHQVAVIEMGASKPGDIKELVEIAHPNIGLITNIGVAHIEGFGTTDAILETKSELFDYLLHHNGQIVLNLDDPRLFSKWSHHYTLGYSCLKNPTPNILAGNALRSTPYLSMVCRHQTKGLQSYPITTQLVGQYNLSNILAALALASLLHISIPDAIPAIERYKPSNHRSQLITGTKGRHLIADAYNANPSSMIEALESLAQMSSRTKIAILGDMAELGTASSISHQRVLEWLSQHSETISPMLCGHRFKEELGIEVQVPLFDTVEQIKAYLIDSSEPIEPDTTILLKGSHSIHLEKIIPILTQLINS